MKAFNLGAGREVLWDMELADKVTGVSLHMHKPVRKNVVLDCNEPWEGEHCGYGSMIFDGERYRLYYRGAGANDGVWKEESGSHSLWCLALSDDGKTFTKPNLGMFEYNGSKDNNIVHMESRMIDNFSVQLDTNPDCPPDEKYKALSLDDLKEVTVNGEKKYVGSLMYYKSADGIHFTPVGILHVKGTFDSLNFVMWDERIGKYRLYFRDFHPLDREHGIEYEAEAHVRDIRVAFSEDFVNWTEPQLLDYGDDKLEIQFYTNGIAKYHRANIFYGMPTRYIDRSPDKINYQYLPDVGGFRPMLIQKHGRGGTAITEATVMTSRDGVSFRRTNEAFLTPGIENGDNWVYGDGYIVRGMVETASDFKGEPNELSLYVGTGYRARPVTFERYTIRMDGLFSWGAGFEGGEVLTKPLTFDGGRMSVNFETSALGYLQIDICDENGEPLEGYSTGRLFGNTTARPCDFAKSLAALSGQAVRLKVSMKDCEFYSFVVES
ncbi:MAG: hypothetical protein IJ493_04285 [Clostridia bacterium]|nr:hypothetical protein [Clostridia bacterium]